MLSSSPCFRELGMRCCRDSRGNVVLNSGMAFFKGADSGWSCLCPIFMTVKSLPKWSRCGALRLEDHVFPITKLLLAIDSCFRLNFCNFILFIDGKIEGLNIDPGFRNWALHAELSVVVSILSFLGALNMR